MIICELKQITRSYGSGPARVDALNKVSLTIESGEFTVFKGPSGSGKTTLLNQIGCLDKPTSGELFLAGKAVHTLSSRELSKLRAETIGFIFQSFNLVPVLSAVENVELALELAGQKENKRNRAEEMLALVGLKGLEKRRPNELSGGQQQRVAIARALVKRPAIVIADEPTANLDSANGKAVMALCARLNREFNTTFLFSSHDPMVVAHARRVITLKDGTIVSDEQGQGLNAGLEAVENQAEARSSDSSETNRPSSAAPTAPSPTLGPDTGAHSRPNVSSSFVSSSLKRSDVSDVSNDSDDLNQSEGLEGTEGSAQASGESTSSEKSTTSSPTSSSGKSEKPDPAKEAS